MNLNRNMKLVIAIVAIVASTMLSTNHFVNRDPLEDWGLAALLFAISLAIWVWIWRENEMAQTSALVVSEEAVMPRMREWVIDPKPVAAPQVPANVESVPTPAAVAVATEEEEADDLTRIEGVGPKYRDALIAAGISTFAELAATTLEQLHEVAAAAGMRNAASMETWAQQAALAAKGDWEALDAMQSGLSGGRRE